MIRACQWVHIIERKRPELFAPIATEQMNWPVLASDKPAWEKEVARHVAGLNLGTKFQRFKVRFRAARGSDANLPACLWAKSAVRVIERAKWQALVVGQTIDDFGSPGAVVDFCMEAGWQTGKRRAWVEAAAKLDGFSRASLPRWKAVIRQMIREDMPDFHQRPDWENQRRTGAASGRDSVGEIQCAILDDICSALARQASETPC